MIFPNGHGHLPSEMRIATDGEMRELGRRLATLLRAGDLVILAGPLGAGKTTLVQGIGAGLRVRGPVTSPTFVIARVHPPLSGSGPALVHADARAEQPPAGERDVDHRDYDEERDLRSADRFVKHVTDRQRRRQGEKGRQPEGRSFRRFSKRTRSVEEPVHPRAL